MGIVLRFEAGHADTPSGNLKPNTDRSTVLRRRRKASEKSTKYSEGMTPKAFQLLIAEAPTPASFAVSDGPPSATTTPSTESIMPPVNSRNVNSSSLHGTAVDFCRDVGSAYDMADSREQIIFRLRLLPDVLDKKAVEIARAAGVSPSAWSNYVSEDASKNTITWEAASELREAFGLTLDWIFCGDVFSIRDERLRFRIQEASREVRRTSHRLRYRA